MQIQDILGQLGGTQSMARELGVSEQEAHSGFSALLPAVMGGFKKHAQAPGSVDGLGDMLGRLGGGGLLDKVLSPQPTDVSHGNNVLGQIFGSKDVSRTVAQTAADRSGVNPSLLKRMLPMVAMMAAGYMAKQRGIGGTGGGIGGLGASALGGARGGLGSLLDLDRDGNPLDDILRMGRGMR
jgi:hypothetical protein